MGRRGKIKVKQYIDSNRLSHENKKINTIMFYKSMSLLESSIFNIIDGNNYVWNGSTQPREDNWVATWSE